MSGFFLSGAHRIGFSNLFVLIHTFAPVKSQNIILSTLVVHHHTIVPCVLRMMRLAPPGDVIFS